MKTYKTVPVSGEAEFDRLLLFGAPSVDIDVLPWGGDYRPRSSAVVCPDFESDGLWVRLQTREPSENIRATVAECNGRVWEDSCLEFFLCPMPEESLGYMNFENNSLGSLLSGVHTAELNGQTKGITAADFRMRTCREFLPGGELSWSVRFFVSSDYVRRFFPSYRLYHGKALRCNFYKCGDLCPKPHYLAWSPIEYGEPSFHRPEFFSVLEV